MFSLSLFCGLPLRRHCSEYSFLTTSPHHYAATFGNFESDVLSLADDRVVCRKKTFLTK